MQILFFHRFRRLWSSSTLLSWARTSTCEENWKPRRTRTKLCDKINWKPSSFGPGKSTNTPCYSLPQFLLSSSLFSQLQSAFNGSRYSSIWNEAIKLLLNVASNHLFLMSMLQFWNEIFSLHFNFTIYLSFTSAWGLSETVDLFFSSEFVLRHCLTIKP